MQENREDVVVPYFKYEELISTGTTLQKGDNYTCGESRPDIRTIKTAYLAGKPVVFEQYKSNNITSHKFWNKNLSKCFSLKHPNILGYPGIFSYTREGVLWYGLIAEHLSKGTLYSTILREDEPLHMSSVLSIAKDIFSGLAYMHSQGFACGNLKPTQIFLEYKQDGTYGAKIATHVLSNMESESDNTPKHKLDQTLRFRPFDSFTREFGDTLDAQKPVDVYAAAMILVMMLSRTEIMPDSSESQMYSLISSGRSVAELCLSPEWPPILCDFILACCAYLPASRPTAQQCLEKITAIEANYHDALLNWEKNSQKWIPNQASLEKLNSGMELSKRWRAIDWRNPKRPVLAEDEKSSYKLHELSLEQQREVETLYSYCPVPGGYTIEKIYAVFNPNQIKAFEARVDILKNQAKNPALRPLPLVNEAADITKARKEALQFYNENLASIYKHHDKETGATVIPTYFWIQNQTILNLLLSHGFSINELFNPFRFGQGVSTSIHPPQKATGDVMTLVMNKVVVRGDVLPVVAGDKVANLRNQGNYYANFVPLTEDGEICGPEDIAENAELVVFDEDAIKVDYVLQLRKTSEPQKPNVIGDNINSFFKKVRPNAVQMSPTQYQYDLPQYEVIKPVESQQAKPQIELWSTLGNQEMVKVCGDEQGNLSVVHPKSGESKTWKAHNGAICSIKFIDDRIVSFSKQDGMKQWDCPVGLYQNAFTL